MSKKARKIVLLTVKITLAVALMAWVLSKVSWHDYAVDASGKTFAVLGQKPGPPPVLEVSTGMPWSREITDRPVADFKPVAEGSPEVVRKGFRSSLANINVALLIVGCAGFGISWIIVAVRWWFLLRIQDIRIRLWEAVRLTFLGQFFNAVVPGTVGGDLVKAYYVAKHTPRKAAALVSIFVDRVLGLTELTLLAAVMVALVLAGGLEPYERVRQPVISVAVVVAIVVFALAFLLSDRFRRSLHLQKIYQRLPVAHHIAAAGDAARLYRRRIGALLKAIGVTFGAHVIWVGSIALLGLSLNLPVPWYNYFTYIPLIYIIGAVPLTPGGVGLVEELYIRFFCIAGSAVNPSEIIALAMLARFIPILWSVPGIFVAVSGPKLPKAAEIQAELEGDSSQGH